MSGLVALRNYRLAVEQGTPRIRGVYRPNKGNYLRYKLQVNYSYLQSNPSRLQETRNYLSLSYPIQIVMRLKMYNYDF